MKTLTLSLFLVALAATSAISQGGRTFYLVCSSNASLYPDFQRDTISVMSVSQDRIVFHSVSTDYTADKVDGYGFLAGGKDMSRFVAYRVDDNSFFIAPPGIDAVSYYHADKRVGDSDDKNKRCAISDLNQFEQLVKIYNQKQDDIAKQKQGEFDSQTKGVLTDWIKNFQSRRSDPVLEKGIRSWWNGPAGTVVVNPMLRVVFLQPSYEVTRNEFGEVLRKTVDTIIVFKMKDGPCRMRWNSFGYESLGGGTFSDEVKQWTKQVQVGMGYYSEHILAPGNREINAGREYEVECAAFVK